jgi:hypothetical protein
MTTNGDRQVDSTWNRLIDELPSLRDALPPKEKVREIVEAAYSRQDWPITLAVCAIFKNEARHIAEWVEFHFNQGVERFYLYDNGSTDDWETALAPFREFIDIIPWPHVGEQYAAYHHCFVQHRLDTRWLAVIDVDEFLFSPTGLSLPGILEHFPRVAAVAVNWRTYGTSGHVDPPAGGLLRNYSKRAPDDADINAHVKSIVVPTLTLVGANAHHFLGVGPAVGERGDLVETPFRRPATAELLRINHYYTRSMSELKAKFASPRPDGAPHPGRPDLDLLNAVNDPILADQRGYGSSR